MDSSVKSGSLTSGNGCSRVFVLCVSGASGAVAALDIMRSAGAEPTVGQALATIVIGFAAPRTDPLIMTAI